MYTQVLESSLLAGRSTGESRSLCDRFKEVVGTIVVLFDELSISSLAELLTRPTLWVEKCLVNLHSVLNVPEDEITPIRLLHPSLRDFLLSQPKPKDGTFFVKEAQIHAQLVTQCLDIIRKSLSRNICSLPEPGSSPSDARQSMLDAKLPKHVRYACLYWVTHLERASQSTNEDDHLVDEWTNQIREFVFGQFLNWLEIMSLLRNMTQAVLMMTKLASLAQVKLSLVSRSSLDRKC